MKKLFIKNWFFLLMPIICICQNPNNHWQLGVSDVNFSTDPAVVGTVANGGKYGNANYSNASGNLVLYTNGVDIWNSSHTAVTNGTGTAYNVDHVLIIPNPANSNQYYIFRAENYPTLGSSLTSGYNYSIVEFNATYPQGIALSINPTPGTLENNYKINLKDASGNEINNTFIFNPITVAKNAASDAYWVIVQSKNKVLSYKIDASGLNTVPVESTFTEAQIYDHGYNSADIGLDLHGKTNAMFKISPDNTKLGGLKYCHNAQDPGLDFASDFYTLNFNSTTGQFTNFVSVHAQSIYYVMNNFEFSNDSGKVYFAKFGQASTPYPKGEIVVKDLSNLSSPERLLYDFNNTSVFPANFNFLQRDRYGNLLISSTSATASRNLYIHKVENQNSYSTSSVKINSITLNGNTISRLPQLIPSITTCATNLVVTANVTSGTDTKQASTLITASNTVSGPAVAVYHAGTAVQLSNGFTVRAGARFRGYIEGCSGNYLGRMADDSVAEDDSSQDIKIDVKGGMKIYPNPSNSMITAQLDGSKIKNLTISRTTDSRVVLTRNAENRDSIEVDVSSFEKGIYIVSIESATGEVVTQKLIKN